MGRRTVMSEPPPVWAVVMAIGFGAFAAGALLAFAIATSKRRLLFASIGVLNALVAVWNGLMLIVRVSRP